MCLGGNLVACVLSPVISGRSPSGDFLGVVVTCKRRRDLQAAGVYNSGAVLHSSLEISAGLASIIMSAEPCTQYKLLPFLLVTVGL